MAKAILGEKIGMTQLFIGDAVVPVTVIKAGPCVVTQVKTEEKDGYRAIQLGYRDLKPERVNMPMTGHFKKANTVPKRFLKEVRTDSEDYTPGQEIRADIFSAGDRVDITGISKGKGFSGVVKRWGFRGGPASHGSTFHRAPGAVGQCASPSRVFKGKKLPGRMGGVRVTVRNLEVVLVDPSKNLVLVKGAVPGVRRSFVVVRESNKRLRTKAKR